MATLETNDRIKGIPSDPYKELEIYLQKINDEIGEVFEKLQHEQKDSPSGQNGLDDKTAENLDTKGAGTKVRLCNGDLRKEDAKGSSEDDERDDKLLALPTHRVERKCRKTSCPAFSGSTPSRSPRPVQGCTKYHTIASRRDRSARPLALDNDQLSQWSDSILAEFNSIIDSELRELEGRECNRSTTSLADDVFEAPTDRLTRSKSLDAEERRGHSQLQTQRSLDDKNSRQRFFGCIVKQRVELSSLADAMGDSWETKRFEVSATYPLTHKSKDKAPTVPPRSTGARTPNSRIQRRPPVKPRSGYAIRRAEENVSGNEPAIDSCKEAYEVGSRKVADKPDGKASREHPLSNGVHSVSETRNTPRKGASNGVPYLCSGVGRIDRCNSEENSVRKKGVKDAITEKEMMQNGTKTGGHDAEPPNNKSNSEVQDTPRKHLQAKSPGDLQSFIKRVQDTITPDPDIMADVGTQTSPMDLSPSSSFTWVSECSSLVLSGSEGETSRRSSSHSPLSDSEDGGPAEDVHSSGDSLSESLEAGPESGIGTASPRDRASRSPDPARNKVRRKETWEKLRRRHSGKRSGSFRKNQEVWIRRENVETQTNADGCPGSPLKEDSSSGADEVEKKQQRRTRAASPEATPRDQTRVRMSSLPKPKIKPLLLRSSPAGSTSSNFETTPSEERAPSLPSPTTASLKIPTSPLVAELGTKSSSAPLLKNPAPSGGESGKSQDDGVGSKRILVQPRSHSERHLAEIEAAEACKWLRAAGFPQYAQMYEDLQFPIDVSAVQKDHPFLDQDSLQSLFRRLNALNRCAKMKVDSIPKKLVDDSDEDDQCALSENWTFQHHSRRWSRVSPLCDVTIHHAECKHSPPGNENNDISEDPMCLGVPKIEAYSSLPAGGLSDDSALDPDVVSSFRRTGSERLKDGAKALLKRMESLKSKRRKKQHREGIIISGPQVLDVATMQQRMKDLNCVDITPPGSGNPSPEPTQKISPPPFDDSSSYYSASDSQNSTPHFGYRHKTRKLFQRKPDDVGAYSDSECQPSSWRHQYFKDANSNHTKVVEFVGPSSPKESKTEASQEQKKAGSSKGSNASSRTGSLNLGKESQLTREKLQLKQVGNSRAANSSQSQISPEEEERHSFYDNVPVVIYNRSYREGHTPVERKASTQTQETEDSGSGDVTVYREEKSVSSEMTTESQDSGSTNPSQIDSDHDDEVVHRQKAAVNRWHSFQRGSSRPASYSSPNGPHLATPMSCLSCGQLMVLRKLALLRLTACMERYCPTHRSGWNWELPKFIRKIKSPDYKDKTVFGVPLLLSLQRTGHALPKSIQAALRWLRQNSLDQVGLFRKSGVRSRIQKLKQMNESQGEHISYDGQQAYDVADMVKQYFRELPEALLTTKLSETFIAIFQFIPVNQRYEAVQWVLLLLPDEHRETLQFLLDFLAQVATRSPSNQMTASNLAVCLAPSLFHSPVTPRSTSASPRRRKTVGVPDARELSENKAAHECLLYLIRENKKLFCVSEEMLLQCHFNYMEESVPVALEELGAEIQLDWRGYLNACITAMLKEAREKSRGWVSMSGLDSQVDIAYKKVGDGHPLRLWRVATEVEAPPLELLNRVLREQHIWDYSLLKWRIVTKLDNQVEVFQYVSSSMAPQPAKDYCVLRSWRSDLPKGACVIVETSVEHPDANVMLGGVRAIVLASRYLIEPCGSGKSRIMHLSRVDTKGRTPEWYNKSYGHICALHLTRIRDSFKHSTDGPESKV